MALKASLLSRPVIYEIVPPRRDTSRFSTELRGVEGVLEDERIAAINIPELIRRRMEHGVEVYSPATIPPEEYAMMIRDRKESIVNLIAPRLETEAFLRRVRRVLIDYRIPNMVLVGRERREDRLPGPEVVQALRLASKVKPDQSALGGICIFSRESSGTDSKRSDARRMSEAERVWHKANAGAEFVTAQISFEPAPAVRFLRAYEELCQRTGKRPITVFVSLTTVPTLGILTLLDSLDVVVPADVRKRLVSGSDMAKESIKIAAEVFNSVVSEVKDNGIRVPLGLHIEQVGVNSGDLSLQLLDSTYTILRGG